MNEQEQIRRGIDERITVHAGEFVIKKGVPGGHSLTPREFASISKLRDFEVLSKLEEKTLEKRNDSEAKYYLVEDGTIIKSYPERVIYYRLNLEDYFWEYDQNLMSLFIDKNLKIQEMPDFSDYFPYSNALNLNKRKNI